MVHAFNPGLGRQRQAEFSGRILSSRPAWTPKWVPGQPGLYRETLSWKTKNKQTKNTNKTKPKHLYLSKVVLESFLPNSIPLTERPPWGFPDLSHKIACTQRITRNYLTKNTQGSLSSGPTHISRRRQRCRPWSSEARGLYRKRVGVREELVQLHIMGQFKHQQTVHAEQGNSRACGNV